MTVQTSTIPAAITYLVNAATAAFPGALVLDGPPRVSDQQSEQKVISIGWNGEEDLATPAVEGDQQFRNMDRGLTRDENYAIVCSIMCWDGSDAVTTSRAAAFGLLATFEKLLRGLPPNGTGDVTLGGAVLWAGISGGISLDYVTGPNGAASRIVFHVTCRARLTGS